MRAFWVWCSALRASPSAFRARIAASCIWFTLGSFCNVSATLAAAHGMPRSRSGRPRWQRESLERQQVSLGASVPAYWKRVGHLDIGNIYMVWLIHLFIATKRGSSRNSVCKRGTDEIDLRKGNHDPAWFILG